MDTLVANLVRRSLVVVPEQLKVQFKVPIRVVSLLGTVRHSVVLDDQVAAMQGIEVLIVKKGALIEAQTDTESLASSGKSIADSCNCFGAKIRTDST